MFAVSEPSLRDLTDVPIERPSVGGMFVASGRGLQPPVKHYVYRGTGEDQFAAPTSKQKRKRKKPKRDPAKILAANIKRAARGKPKPDPVLAEREAHRARVIAEMNERRDQQIAEQQALLALAQEPQTRRYPAPSPGWKPSTGEDIDEWLSDLD